jgi:hypothetical protein
LASEETSARLTWTALTQEKRHPFRLSYGVEFTHQVFWIGLSNWLDLDALMPITNGPFEGL